VLSASSTSIEYVEPARTKSRKVHYVRHRSPSSSSYETVGPSMIKSYKQPKAYTLKESRRYPYENYRSKSYYSLR